MAIVSVFVCVRSRAIGYGMIAELVKSSDTVCIGICEYNWGEVVIISQGVDIFVNIFPARFELMERARWRYIYYQEGEFDVLVDRMIEHTQEPFCVSMSISCVLR